MTNPETYKVPEFNVTNAQLNRLNYTETNHTLSYNLALNITLTNPNKKILFKLTDIQVIAYHQNKRFGLVTLMDRQTSFDQNPKSSSVFNNAVIQGWKPMMFEEPVLPNADLYNIDVVIAFREKGAGLSGQVMCNLKLPLSFNGTSWNCYKTRKCSKVFYYRGS
ncbi:NDR1/HIN1-like protein 3 [Prunus persica]|nr:NDR1/HIN1-like protein 3 [Prunus persica]